MREYGKLSVRTLSWIATLKNFMWVCVYGCHVVFFLPVMMPLILLPCSVPVTVPALFPFVHTVSICVRYFQCKQKHLNNNHVVFFYNKVHCVISYSFGKFSLWILRRGWWSYVRKLLSYSEIPKQNESKCGKTTHLMLTGTCFKDFCHPSIDEAEEPLAAPSFPTLSYHFTCMQLQ